MRPNQVSVWMGCLVFAAVSLGSNACADDSKRRAEQIKLEPVLAEAAVDRAVATTGDVITYRVKVDFDEMYEIQMVEPGSKIAGFRIVDLGREEVAKRSGRIIEERWYKLRADLVGSYILPPLRVAYRRGGEASDSLPLGELQDNEDTYDSIETSAIFVEVESVLPSDEEATDIRGLKPVRQVRGKTRFWWLLGGAVGLVLLGVILYVIRRRRTQVVLPPRPPHERAFEALRLLREIDLERPELVRKFHFAISEAIRTYVEGRFNLNAKDLTTEEILFKITKLKDLAVNNRERLESFLKDTDQVKFADYMPTGSEIEDTYERALTFVESSIPTLSGEASA